MLNGGYLGSLWITKKLSLTCTFIGREGGIRTPGLSVPNAEICVFHIRTYPKTAGHRRCVSARTLRET